MKTPPIETAAAEIISRIASDKIDSLTVYFHSEGLRSGGLSEEEIKAIIERAESAILAAWPTSLCLDIVDVQDESGPFTKACEIEFEDEEDDENPSVEEVDAALIDIFNLVYEAAA